ncbi:MAG: hypothetical protein JWM68_762 [Verrucomicrobiales bacterium]|nr:hypothetical protein [Verrucomicrobiales bacterium]
MQDPSRPPNETRVSAFCDYFTPVRFGLILFVLILATFPQVLIFGQSFVFRDFGLFGYPLAFYARESLSSGQIPLWDPYNNCGIPFLAQWNTQVLYPVSWIYLVIPSPWSVSLFCLLHIFWAGIGMYFLASRWTGNRLAAALAGTAFVFNGFTLNCLMWPNCIATLAWMPWTVLAVESAWRTGGRRMITASFVATLQMLAGTPEYILMTWLLLTGLCTTHLLGHRSEIKTVAGRFLLIVILVTALCAAQLGPFLDLLAHSQRNAGLNSENWAMPFFGLGNFFVPLFRSYESPTGVFFLYEQAYTSSYYLGIGVLALALIAMWRVRETRVKVLGIVALCCAIFALGDNAYVYTWVRSVFPIFAFMRYPVKFVVLLTFVIPLLMAFAIRAILEATDRKAEWLRTIITVGVSITGLILLILLFSHAYPYREEVWNITCKSGVTRILFLLGTFVALYSLTKMDQKRNQIFLSFGLIGIFWFDTLTHAPSQNPVVTTEAFRPGLPPLHELTPQPTLGEARVMVSTEAWHVLHRTILSNSFNGYICSRLAMDSDCNLLDHLPKVDGLFSMYLREESDVRKRLYGNTNLTTHVADFLNVAQITAPGKIFDWQSRPSFMPVITAGQKPLFVRAEDSLEMLFVNFDPRKTVLLRSEAKPLVSVTNQSNATISNQKWSAHRISFDVEATSPAMTVLSQVHYHAWKAYVDNIPTPILRANHAYQALQVEGGHHHVELVYEDRVFYASAAVSGLTLLLCAGALLKIRRDATKVDRSL